MLRSILLIMSLLVSGLPAQAQILPQTEAERIQAETQRMEREREQRAQDQLRDRTQDAERQDRRRQQELRQLERTPPSSRPAPRANPRNYDPP